MASSTGGRYRDALRQRDFRLMVVAYIVDALGGWAYSVVLAVYVWDRTHSTQWLAAMASAGWLTSLLVGGYAGVLADRYERTRVMIVSALANAAVMSVIAVVVGTNGPLGCSSYSGLSRLRPDRRTDPRREHSPPRSSARKTSLPRTGCSRHSRA